MQTVAFDIGGVLRPVYISGSKERNWSALRSLYKMFCASPEWKVVITTYRPLSKSTFQSVWDELEEHGLPRPDELRIESSTPQKRSMYQEVKPDLVVDDRDSCIKEAIELGITTLKVD